jgi:hypothetical protein
MEPTLQRCFRRATALERLHEETVDQRPVESRRHYGHTFRSVEFHVQAVRYPPKMLSPHHAFEKVAVPSIHVA